jgi:hypothetical protein
MGRPRETEKDMNSTARRGITIAAASVLALGGAGILTACGGSSSDSTTSSSAAASSSSEGGTGVIGPVIVEPGTTSAEISVGRIMTFNVADPMVWMVSTSDPEVMDVTPGKQEMDGATYLPGGEALKEGTAEIVLTNMDNTDDKWTIQVTVTP